MVDETGSGEGAGQPQASDTQQAEANSQQQSNSVLGGGGSGDVSAQPTGGQNADQGVQEGKSFLDQVTDETIRKDPSLQHIKNVDDLAKGYVHAQHLVGKDRIPLPSSDDDHEAWNDVLGKLGRPDDPSKYEIPKPAEDSPVQLPEGMDQKFAAKAHELGLTNKQARDLFGWYVNDVAEPEFQSLEQKMEEARQEGEKALRKEFGNAFNDAVADAQRAVKNFGGDEVLQKLDQSGLSNDPEVVKFLAKIGENFREDTVGGSSPQFGRSPDQAKAEIGRLKQDQQFMQTYMNGQATGHDEAVQRMEALYRDAYPNG